MTGRADVLDSIPDRIYSQYRNAPKSVKWLNITRGMAKQISDASTSVRSMYEIDTATSGALDIIGRIVGQDRDFIASIQMAPSFCASENNNPALVGDGSDQCSALSVYQDAKMSDELFRFAIRSKIIKNNSDATIDGILHSVNFLLPDAVALRCIDNEDMSFAVEIYGKLTEVELFMLKNYAPIAKPQGVKFTGYLHAHYYVQCGDSSLMCGNKMAQCVGFTGV